MTEAAFWAVSLAFVAAVIGVSTCVHRYFDHLEIMAGKRFTREEEKPEQEE